VPDLGDIYFNAMMLLKNKKEREEILELFHLGEQGKKSIRERWNRLSETMRDLAWIEKKPHSSIARLLRIVGIEDLLIIMSLSKRENTVRAVSLYLSRLRFIRKEIDGKTLRKMGYVSGPIYREIMLAVQDARVDGLVNSLAEEKRWVKENFPIEIPLDQGKEESRKVKEAPKQQKAESKTSLTQKRRERADKKTRGREEAGGNKKPVTRS